MCDFPIVGIGSSAGGLEALRKLFETMPADGGLGFVVAAHLDPTRESHLAELLGRYTTMSVIEIGDQVAVEPDHVYVIAPDRELRIKDGVLYSDRPRAPRGHRHPVDSFFRSLAEDQGERAIAIVLSGTGTNGSLGLRFIKAEGGIALAQDPETAAFQGMPRSAIGTGIVDLVLAPEKMPDALLGLARHTYVRQPAKVADAAPEDQLNTLLALLYAQAGQDFKGYKRGTLLRRIHRRMGLHRINDLQHYIERLRSDGQELKALVGDLTINVTGFFRDPEAWETLAQTVIAPLLKERATHATVRVWVPGCSTGEEVYSVAMLVAEQADALGKSFDVRMFATDVAEGVLSAARAGQYPASVTMDVGERRLQRFFEQQDGTYCVKKAIRDAVTFAPQNLLQDPPFSRLDLVSCRNLLIYLQPEVQRQLLGLFHFALREGGHLFLGSAETISGNEDLFQTVSKKWRIYRRVGPTRHDVVDFSVLGGSMLPTGLDRSLPNLPGSPPEPRVRAGELMMQALADRFAPASALIDAQHRVLYLRGPTGNYLQPASGEPSHNLIAMARDGLQMPLRQAVRKALSENDEVATEARVRRNGALHPVRLIVTPLKLGRDDGARRLLVSFLEGDRTVDPATAPAVATETPGDGPSQAELDTAREDLRLTIEQMEASNEEMKASNEEIRSINEELQATNEELETSKEELQSLNEELNTVNNQLQAKVSELEERTNDLNNLLNSTDIATLFLDRSLAIRWFTPAMKALFELMPSDIGRPIAHFAQRFSGGDLVEDAKSVLAKLAPMDTEVVSADGKWYIRHMLPYRTDDDRIDGIVVSFTDISERKQGEQQVLDAKEFAESIVDTVRLPLLVLASDLTVQSANSAFLLWFQVNQEETEGRPIFELGNQQWDIAELRRLLLDVLPTDNQFEDFEVEHDFETIGRRTMLLNGRRLDSVQLILLAIEDITERKRAEAEQELLAWELSHRVKNIFAIVQALAKHTGHNISTAEEYRERFLGRLQAMAQAHAMLLDTNWQHADVRTLAEAALEAYRVDHPDATEIIGDTIMITAKQGLGLSLILHELGTNAAKYGALSSHEGRLRVSWVFETHDDGRRVRLEWRERHGPRIDAPPTERGFGTKLIKQVCSFDLEGEVEPNYAPEGLICTLTFPLK